MTKTQVVICPYCGATQSAAVRCRGCGGLFEPLSRQATHNAMGPWFVRDPGKPFQPGCSYETIVRMIDRGQVSKYSIVRGPTSKQFWTVAKHLAGVSHLLGYCHNCDASVDPGDNGCHVCGVSFGAYLDRNYLGLPDVRPLPWEAGVESSSARRPGEMAADSFERMSGAAGISGFASDDELIDPGLARTPSPVGRSDHEFSGERVPAAPDFDDQSTTATERALRRMLEGRQRTVRVLAVMLSVMVILFVVTTVATTLRNFADEAAVTHEPVAVTPAPESEPPELPMPQPPMPQPPTPQPPMPEIQVHEPAVDPATAANTRAQQLIDSAGRENRSLDERIGDLELALKELKDLDATAPAESISQTISQVENDLEQLRLEREFFGAPEPD